MVGLLYELRGQLSHEIEARKSLEFQLSEVKLSMSDMRDMRSKISNETDTRRNLESTIQDLRFQINELKDFHARNDNKWQNLLGRVKELEVGQKVENRLLDMNQRVEKFHNKNNTQVDRERLMMVFSEIKNRMDGQERQSKDELIRLQREVQRDHERTQSEIRNQIERAMVLQEQKNHTGQDDLKRLTSKISDVEKELALFMNTTMQMQSAIDKKQDADWLKIYLVCHHCTYTKPNHARRIYILE